MVKASFGVGITLATLMLFATVLIAPGNKTGLSDFTAAQLMSNSFLCHHDQQETNSFAGIRILCTTDHMCVKTWVNQHQFQIHILLDDWTWKIEQVIWQIPRNSQAERLPMDNISETIYVGAFYGSYLLS